MQLAHVIELDPTAAQLALFKRAAGIARLAYNWGLARWTELHAAGQETSWMALQREFTARIDGEFPFCRLVPSTVYNQPFRHLGKAFTNFLTGRARRPRFKSRHRSEFSFTLSGDIQAVRPGVVSLPRIHEVRTKEDLRFNGRIISATLSQDAERWVLAVLFDLPDERRANTGAGTVGIDLGLAHFATLSSGEQVDAPKPLVKHQRRLRRLSRRLSRKKKGSRRRQRARQRVRRLHRRIRNIRKDFLHQLSTRMVRENPTIVLDDLAVGNLLQNHALATHISDAGWGEFKRQITYKAELHGRTVLQADAFYPSSRRCSGCGHRQLGLADRTYSCPACGLVIDRDLNAAINLSTLALRGTDARGEFAPLVVQGNLAAKRARGTVNRHAPRARKISPAPVGMCRQ